ncbi:MAG TPA: glycosyltransferase [Phycisphaerales bacterium]|nr:glycosyltransferase [Phycisphaerales bacterium]
MEHAREVQPLGRAGQTSNEYRFSIVIPVLHEAERINDCLEQILSLQSDKAYEIIVVDADPNGETINSIRHRHIITAVSEPGRAKQMNAGAALAGGDILIFLHADTQLPADAFERIAEALKDEKYVGGAFDLGIDSDNFWLRATASRARLRSRLTRVPYGDQAIFLRKNYFDKIGRFKEIALMEDVELMRRIKKRGDKIFILCDQVKTSARRWEKEGVFYTTLRNIVLVTLYTLGVSPDWLARYYSKAKA